MRSSVLEILEDAGLWVAVERDPAVSQVGGKALEEYEIDFSYLFIHNGLSFLEIEAEKVLEPIYSPYTFNGDLKREGRNSWSVISRANWEPESEADTPTSTDVLLVGWLERLKIQRMPDHQPYDRPSTLYLIEDGSLKVLKQGTTIEYRFEKDIGLFGRPRPFGFTPLKDLFDRLRS